MNEADREKLERLKAEWRATLPDKGTIRDADHAFAYWLVRHSGWTVLPPGEGPPEWSRTTTRWRILDQRREDFAGRALQGLITTLGANPARGDFWAGRAAKFAVENADALIAELDKEVGR